MARRCPICGANHSMCIGTLPRQFATITVSEGEPRDMNKALARFHDGQGNVFSVTPDDAKKQGLQPYNDEYKVVGRPRGAGGGLSIVKRGDVYVLPDGREFTSQRAILDALIVDEADDEADDEDKGNS